jgi:hypothetical protein
LEEQASTFFGIPQTTIMSQATDTCEADIASSIVMYHNGSSSKTIGCAQMESACWIARKLLDVANDTCLFEKLCEKISPSGCYGSPDTRMNKQLSSVLQQKFQHRTSEYVHQVNHNKGIKIVPVSYEVFRNQLTTWRNAVECLHKINGRFPTHACFKAKFEDAGMRAIRDWIAKFKGRKAKSKSESGTGTKRARLCRAVRSKPKAKTKVRLSDLDQEWEVLEDPSTIDAITVGQLPNERAKNGYRLASTGKERANKKARLSTEGGITHKGSEMDPPRNIPEFDRFESRIPPGWEKSLVMCVAIEDWGDKTKPKQNKEDFINFLATIAQNNMEESYTRGGRLTSAYDSEGIANELTQYGLDKTDLPNKITFVCTGLVFAYTFANACHRPHGMISLITAKRIEAVCRAMNLSLQWVRGNQPELPLRGSNLPVTYLNQQCEDFRHLFGTLRLDPGLLLALVQEKGKKDDKRSVFIWHGGYSTQDHKRKVDVVRDDDACSTPNLCGRQKHNEIYRELGSIADCLQDYLDTYCLVDGHRPYNDPFRFSMFGKNLRDTMHARRWRADAINVSFERVCTEEEVRNLANNSTVFDFSDPRRHTDDRDDDHPELQHTAIFSFYFLDAGYVWRGNIIAFSRRCLSTTIVRCNNRTAVRRRLREYKSNSNGGFDFHNFNLMEEMNLFITKGSYSKLRADMPYTKGNQPCEAVTPLQWLEDNQHYPGFRFIEVAEFMTCFGYSSAHASAINKIRKFHMLPRPKVIELILIALKGFGIRNFCYILTVVWEKRSRDQLVSGCLQHLYWADSHRLSGKGGGVGDEHDPQIRADCDGMEGLVPKEAMEGVRSQSLPLFPFVDKEEQKQFEIVSDKQVLDLTRVIDNIEDPTRDGSGDHLDQDYMYYMSEIASLLTIKGKRRPSFFQILVMTGTATSNTALNLSLCSPVDWGADYGRWLSELGINTYKDFTKLCSDLKTTDKWEEETVGNGCYCDFLPERRKDEYHHGQTLFLIKKDEDEIIRVYQKMFGTSAWTHVKWFW